MRITLLTLIAGLLALFIVRPAQASPARWAQQCIERYSVDGCSDQWLRNWHGKEFRARGSFFKTGFDDGRISFVTVQIKEGNFRYEAWCHISDRQKNIYDRYYRAGDAVEIVGRVFKYDANRHLLRLKMSCQVTRLRIPATSGQ